MTPSPESSGHRETPSYAVARQLLERELGGTRAHDASGIDASAIDASVRVEGALHHVHATLSRSFGAYGSVALFTRALTHARARHPVLSRVTVVAGAAVDPMASGNRQLHVDGLPAVAPEVGADAVLTALTEWLAQITDLLGELIGDELARSILIQDDMANRADDSRPDAHPMADEP